jgi:antitoxin component YwqK of YwqJK toxin-antitoxin module
VKSFERKRLYFFLFILVLLLISQRDQPLIENLKQVPGVLRSVVLVVSRANDINHENKFFIAIANEDVRETLSWIERGVDPETKFEFARHRQLQDQWELGQMVTGQTAESIIFRLWSLESQEKYLEDRGKRTFRTESQKYNLATIINLAGPAKAKNLLLRDPKAVDLQEPHGSEALGAAVIAKDESLLVALIENGADQNAFNSKNNRPLRDVALSEDYKVLLGLLATGAAPETQEMPSPGISANVTLKPDFAAKFASDQNPESAWCAPADSRLLQLSYRFDNPKNLSYIGLINGFTKFSGDRDLFHANARIKNAVASFSNGKAIAFELADVPFMQFIPVGQENISWLKIEALSFTKGSKWNDVCVSEISLIESGPLQKEWSVYADVKNLSAFTQAPFLKSGTCPPYYHQEPLGVGGRICERDQPSCPEGTILKLDKTQGHCENLQGVKEGWHYDNVSRGNFSSGKKWGLWKYWPETRHVGEFPQAGAYKDGIQEGWWVEPKVRNYSEGLYEDGKRHGHWRTFEFDGENNITLLEHGSYFHGVEDGDWFRQILDKFPPRIEQGRYEKGLREGPWMESILGAQPAEKSKGSYSSGKKSGRWIEYLSPLEIDIAFKSACYESEFESETEDSCGFDFIEDPTSEQIKVGNHTFYKAHLVKLEGSYLSGKPNGRWSIKKTSGELIASMNFLNGSKERASFIYFPSENKKEVINFKGDTRHGTYQKWNVNGSLSISGHYFKGKRHGRWMQNEPGGISLSGEYKNGAPVGIWKRTDQKGKVIEETRY